ncbi:MAG: acetoin utilization protein AcuB [Clostridia bacterium]|jgi:acetoin utilization protein AcuB|nr:acuB [Clostridiales bacterium]MDK2984821.1 acetoin utilization protein AcuB [Clostridia bacterium]
MLVEEIMVTKVVTVKPETKLKTALEITRKNNIRHLPVVNKNKKLVGIVSDRDLRSASPSPVYPGNESVLEEVTMKDIMQESLITVHPMDFIEEAARLLYEHKIGCLPVVRDNELVGIVTETDILRTLVELLGFFKEGSHIEVEVPHKPGSLAKVAGIVGDHGVNIDSILLSKGSDSRSRVIILRLQSLDIRKIQEDFEKNGFKVKWPLKPGECCE